MLVTKRVRATSRRSYPDLKTWRESHEWSQQEAAAHLSISQKAYSRLERGQRFVKGELAKRLMDQTGVSLEVLVGVA